MIFRTPLPATLALSVLISTPCVATPKSTGISEPRLIGTWRVVRVEDRHKNGSIDRPFGERPLGYFVYDATGHLSVQMMRTPPPKPFASGDTEKGTQAEEAEAWESYGAYFGTYSVDKVHHVLHHMIEGSMSPGYVNTDQVRPYKLKGDTRTIEIIDPVDGTHYYRELRRVR